jgi:hypothetical protein
MYLLNFGFENSFLNNDFLYNNIYHITKTDISIGS